MATLLQTNTENQGSYLPVGKGTHIVGRSEALPMQVLDPQVSRKHLRIHFDKDTGQHYASDLNSRHGTFVNDRKIEQETPLVEGDIIRIGNALLVYMDKDFDDAQSALYHYRKIGERSRVTMV